jgi:hypothetical protein
MSFVNGTTAANFVPQAVLGTNDDSPRCDLIDALIGLRDAGMFRFDADWDDAAALFELVHAALAFQSSGLVMISENNAFIIAFRARVAGLHA